MTITSVAGAQEVLRLKVAKEPLSVRAAKVLAEMKESSIFTDEDLAQIALAESYLEDGEEENGIVLVLARVIEPSIESLAEEGHIELLDWEEGLIDLLREALPVGESPESALALFKEADARVNLALPRKITAIGHSLEKKRGQLYEEAARVDQAIQASRQDFRSKARSIQEGRLKSMDEIEKDVLELSDRVQDSVQRLREAASQGAKMPSNEEAIGAVCKAVEGLSLGGLHV